MVTLDEENFKGLLSNWGLAARPCDTCRTAAALLYCKVDAAFLCGACDSKLHRHARHERVWMCEVCEQAPAAVTCKADAAALCTACDRDIHSANPLARRHERVPVVPFLDSADDAAVIRSSTTAAPAAATSLLISDDLAAVPAPIAPALLRGGDDDDDEIDAETWLIPNPSFLYSNDSDLLHHHFGVPSLSSSLNNLNHNSQQQQHKMNIQQQKQHKMNIQQQQSASFAFTDSVVPSQSNGNLSFSNDVTHSFQNCFDIDFSQPHKHHNKIISAFNNYSSPHSVTSSDIGVVPDGNANSMSEVSYTFTKSTTTVDGTSSAATNTGAPAPVMDREARVLRYREKRKNRKFEKTIRYASRKAYAETRPRIKGRFAKRTETSDVVSEIDQLYGPGFGLDHGGYGVVPSF